MGPGDVRLHFIFFKTVSCSITTRNYIESADHGNPSNNIILYKFMLDNQHTNSSFRDHLMKVKKGVAVNLNSKGCLVAERSDDIKKTASLYVGLKPRDLVVAFLAIPEENGLELKVSWMNSG